VRIDVSRAMIARHQLLVDNLAAMDGVDVMIMPVSAGTAPPIPEVTANAVLSDGRPISGDNVGPRFMMPNNVTGQPAITVPVAIASDGLPPAVQVVGRPFGEVAVLRAATLLAQSSNVDLRPPDFR
jgi:Asp-tRNA(Asn)/Glu-tRNA(Gln) amidotransferase A subunit family amidase